MKIFLSPQFSDKKIVYEFNGEVITATLDGTTDVFDFSSFPDGEITHLDVDTTLSVKPIIRAVRENGVLEVELLNYIGKDATQDEKFPVWKDV